MVGAATATGAVAVRDLPKGKGRSVPMNSLSEQSRRFGKQLADVFGLLRASADVLERVELLARLGWIIPVHMSLPELHELVLQNSLTMERVDNWFVEYYRQRSRFCSLSKLLLSSRLAFWRPLIEQCLKAFERGDHVICVPSLLLVLDGAMARLWQARAWDKRDRNKFFDRKIHGSHPKSVMEYMWRSVHVFINEVFDDTARPGRDYPIVKRHLILHGTSDPSTWGEANCLRLFQAISTIVSLQSTIESRDKVRTAAGKIPHRATAHIAGAPIEL